MTAPPAAGTAYRILPVYLVLDVTVPARSKTPATAAVVPLLRDALAVHPVLSDKLRLAVIDVTGGTDGAEVRLPLSDLLDPQLAVAPPALRPSLRPGGPADRAPAMVRRRLEDDVARLEREGFAVHHPLVWTILGPAAGGSWVSTGADLAAAASAPTVVHCRFTPAGSDDVPAAAGPDTSAGYAADPALPAAAAVTALTGVLATTLVRTGHSLGATGRRPAFPADDELPAGVTVRMPVTEPADDAQDAQDAAGQDATSSR